MNVLFLRILPYNSISNHYLHYTPVPNDSNLSQIRNFVPFNFVETTNPNLNNLKGCNKNDAIIISDDDHVDDIEKVLWKKKYLPIIPGLYVYKIKNPNGVGNVLQPKSYVIVYRILIPANKSSNHSQHKKLTLNIDNKEYCIEWLSDKKKYQHMFTIN